MLICDKCGEKEGVFPVAIGELAPSQRHRQDVLLDKKAYDRGITAFEGDLCTSCQMNVWDAIKEATKPKEKDDT